jgi:hypothetical protein
MSRLFIGALEPTNGAIERGGSDERRPERSQSGKDRKRILMVASNPAVSEADGVADRLLVGRAFARLLEFAESGYQIDIVSPDGGDLEADAWSDPRDDSGYSADDLISLDS